MLKKITLDNIWVNGYKNIGPVLDFENLEKPDPKSDALDYYSYYSDLGKFIGCIKEFTGWNSSVIEVINPDDPGILHIETDTSDYTAVMRYSKNLEIIYEDLTTTTKDLQLSAAYENGILKFRKKVGDGELSGEDSYLGRRVPVLSYFENNIINSLIRVFIFGSDDDTKFNRRYGGEGKDVLNICNKLIPAAFEGISEVDSFGNANHKGHIIPSQLEGSGYNIMLDISKSIYLVLKTDSIVIMPEIKWGHFLHPLLRKEVKNLLVSISSGDKAKKKGNLIYVPWEY